MYRFIHITLILLAMHMASAQQHEIGVFLGGSNPISDVGRTYYLYPNKIAFGGIYKWNFHERMAVRVQVTKSELRANDAQSDIPGKRNRGFAYSSDITDLAVGTEFNFFSYRIGNLLDMPMTPYVFVGIAGLWHDDLYFDPSYPKPVEATDTTRRDFDVAVPVAFGFKAKITRRLVLGGEVAFRFALTNNVDGSAPERKSFTFGNIGRSYDWYAFSGLTLTYTFGEWPCYCR